MSLNLKEIKGTVKKFPRLEDDTYLSRIVSVIDLGVQPQTDWQTKEPVDSKRQVMITFEVPSELITYEDKEGNEVTKPHHLHKNYTLSMHEMAALTKLIKAIKPDCEGLEELLNTPCMITVGSTHTGNAKVTAVNKPMKGVEVGELVNDTTYFDFDEPNMDLFNSTYEWIQKVIKGADNYDGFADEASDY